jgi:LAO/AO transport system kinase
MINNLIEGLKIGDRKHLSRAITLIESTLTSDKLLANQLLENVIHLTGNSIRIGITGPPGVGKSSFIEVFGEYITSLNKKLAVLAVDPSSKISKGSILGDKTRMENLAVNPLAFIRPAANHAQLGGIAEQTFETILLCEAAGYELVVIETVGVGQAEIEVNNLVDYNIFLHQIGSGDELQGIKMGVLEHADLIIITKADGTNLDQAIFTQNQLKYVLHSNSQKDKNIEVFSIFEPQKMADIWAIIIKEINLLKKDGHFDSQRLMQKENLFYEKLKLSIIEKFLAENRIKIEDIFVKFKTGEINLNSALQKLI